MLTHPKEISLTSILGTMIYLALNMPDSHQRARISAGWKDSTYSHKMHEENGRKVFELRVTSGKTVVVAKVVCDPEISQAAALHNFDPIFDDRNKTEAGNLLIDRTLSIGQRSLDYFFSLDFDPSHKETFLKCLSLTQNHLLSIANKFLSEKMYTAEVRFPSAVEEGYAHTDFCSLLSEHLEQRRRFEAVLAFLNGATP